MSYRVEYAKTNRGGCQAPTCKKTQVKVVKGALKFGSWVDLTERPFWSYRHWGCVTPQQILNARTAIDGDVNLFDGYEDLEEEDQARVTKALEVGHIADEDCFGVSPEINRPGAAEAKKEEEKKAKQEQKAAEKAEKAAQKAAEKEKVKAEKEAAKQAAKAEKEAAKEAAKLEKEAAKAKTKAKKEVEPDNEAEGEGDNVYLEEKPQKGKRKVKKEETSPPPPKKRAKTKHAKEEEGDELEDSKAHAKAEPSDAEVKADKVKAPKKARGAKIKAEEVEAPTGLRRSSRSRK